MAGALSADDKLLGEKMHYYCSSSEDEYESCEEDTDFVDKEQTLNTDAVVNSIQSHSGRSTNTGPKGVVEDWRRYKQLESEKNREKEVERLNLHKKLSITCRSYLNDEEEKAEDDALLEELEALDDDFMTEYRQKRIVEMRNICANIPTFESVISLNTPEEFLDASEKTHALTTVVVHVYEQNASACLAMNGCLDCLCKDYPTVKFCKVLAHKVRLSSKFSEEGVPALLVYKKGELVGNYVGLVDVLGNDFFAEDVESFLNQHGHLPNKAHIGRMAGITA